MVFLSKTLLDKRPPSHFLSITLPVIRTNINKMETISEKQNPFFLKSLRVIPKIQLNFKSNSGIKVIREWLTNNNGQTKTPNDSFAYDDYGRPNIWSSQYSRRKYSISLNVLKSISGNTVMHKPTSVAFRIAHFLDNNPRESYL